MNTFSNLTTATEIQRDYKAVSKRARASDEALIVMLNNKPDLVVMRFDYYQHLIDLDGTKKDGKKKSGLESIFGAWTKQEAEEFNKVVDEMNERIDPKDWKQ